MRRDWGFLLASCSHLNNESIVGQVGLFAAKVLYFLFVVVAEIVKAQTIFLRIHHANKFTLKFSALGSIERTFKYGILNTLSKINTFFCDVPKPFAPGRIFCVDIIGYQYQHNHHFHKKVG